MDHNDWMRRQAEEQRRREEERRWQEQNERRRREEQAAAAERARIERLQAAASMGDAFSKASLETRGIRGWWS